MARTAKQLIQLILQGKDLTGPEFQSATKSASELEKGLGKVSKVALGMGLALATGLGAAVVQAGQLEAGVANALTLIDVEKEEFDALTKGMTEQAIALSRELGVSAEEISESFYQVLSAGAEALSPQFDALAKTAIQMADLVGLETAQAVETLSDTLNAFNLNMEEAGRVADVFFTASKLTATTVPQLAAAFREAGPAAAALGISIETTATLLDAFASKGIKANKAGTALRIILTRLTAGTDEVKAALKEMNVEVFDQDQQLRPLLDILEEMQVSYRTLTDEQKALTLKTIAGEEAFSKLAGILDSDIGKLREWNQTIIDGGGFQEAFTRKQETFQGQLRLLQQEFKAVVFTIGTELLPIVTEQITKLREATAETGEWIAANKELVFATAAVSIGLIGAGGVLQAVFLVTRAMRELRKVTLVSFGIATGIGAAIAGTIVAFALLSRKIREVQDEIDAIKDTEEDDLTKNQKGALLRAKQQIEFLKALREQGKKVIFEGVGFKKQLVDIDDAIGRAMISLAEMKRGIIDIEDSAPVLTKQAIVDIEVAAKEAAAATRDWKAETIELASAYAKARGPATEFGTAVEKMLSLLTPEQAEANKEFLRFLDEIEQRKRDRALAEELGPVEDPGLVQSQQAQEMFKEQQKTFAKMESAISAGFRRIMQGGNVFTNFMIGTFEAMANAFIEQVSRMIAKWLAFLALRGLFALATGGVSEIAGGIIPNVGVVPVNLAQRGGTVISGTRGTDSTLVAVGRDEGIFDHTLTDALIKRFVQGEGDEDRQIVIAPVIQAGVITASSQDVNKFSRLTTDSLSNHARRFITRGTK